jgi:hypothetical protein
MTVRGDNYVDTHRELANRDHLQEVLMLSGPCELRAPCKRFSVLRLPVEPKLGGLTQHRLELHGRLSGDDDIASNQMIDMLLREPGAFRELALRHSKLFKRVANRIAGGRHPVGLEAC